jgi:hypothetical protein
MSGNGSLSALGFPRLFWPVTLTLTGAVAALLLLSPVTRMFGHSSLNYNEGWNAYHQQETIQRKPLYGAPPRLVCNKYPPISFHLIGLASRLTGDVNLTGRWVALISLALAATLCGAIVRRLTGSTPLAVYTALSVVIWLAVYSAERIGMNDPQLLGTAFGLFGLYAFIRATEERGWLAISAAAFTISVFTKHNLLAFPAAVGLHLLLGRKWKGLTVWGGVIAGGSVLLLGLTQWIDGPYFFANLLIPRAPSLFIAHATDWATLLQLPILLAVGLYAYIRAPESFAWLSIAAVGFTISAFTYYNLLAFPVAVGFYLVWKEKWKELAVLGGVVAGGSLLLLGLARWMGSPDMVADLTMPRTRTAWLTNVAIYATVFQLTILLAVVWSLRHAGHVMTLALITSNALAVAFASGNGVDRNMFFDAVLSLAVVSALVFAEFAPALAARNWHAFRLAGLLLTTTLGILILIPFSLTAGWAWQRPVRDRTRDFDFSVKLLRSRPGPALCEDLLLCFEAGKAFTFDPYFSNNMVLAGRIKDEELIAMVDSASYRTVQLDGTDLTPGPRPRFTSNLMKALLNRYRVEALLSHSVVMVPKE